MNLVKVRLIKLCVSVAPDIELFERHCLGKSYIVDLDSKIATTNYNTAYKREFILNSVMVYEYGIPCGYMPLEVLEIVESIRNYNNN